MLHRKHAHRSLAPHDRDAREAVVKLLTRLRIIDEVWVAGRLVEVQHLDLLRDRAHQPLAERELGDVHRLLLQASRREQLEHPVAQQIDRADLARQRLADDLHNPVELRLRGAARGHHVMQARQYLPRGDRGCCRR
jgi:hypothetical protein